MTKMSMRYPRCCVFLLGFLLLFRAIESFTVVHRNERSLVKKGNQYGSQSRVRIFSNPQKQQTDDGSLKTPIDAERMISTSSSSSSSSFRQIRRIEKFARLPVWPVWQGVLIWLTSQIFGSEKAAALEHQITGRVCPNFYEYTETDPFIMLVHHCHSFAAWDPIRYIQRQFILPEGFPAHPHRGFVTITYILHGGFIHRDSMGIQQRYGGAMDTTSTTNGNNNYRYNGKHTQWLHTGRGLLHEEMFDIHVPNLFQPNRQELYQIWLNVPISEKMTPPSTTLLGGDQETPTILEETNGSQTIVLAGSYQGQTSAAPVASDVALFHVQLTPGAVWKYDVPSNYETVFLYVRHGASLQVLDNNNNNNNNNKNDDDDDSNIIPVHNTAYFTATGNQLWLKSTASSSSSSSKNSSNNNNHNAKVGTDFILLAGEPLREPCVAQGSMVMSSANEINQAYIDYQSGLFGRPWDHKLSDDEWKKIINNNNNRSR